MAEYFAKVVSGDASLAYGDFPQTPENRLRLRALGIRRLRPSVLDAAREASPGATFAKFWTITIFFIFLSFFFAGTSFAWQRSTPNVPPDSYLYRDLNKLIAFGLVHPLVKGQRPYPRSEFARMTAEAMKNYEEKIKVEVKVEDESLKKFVKRTNRERQIEIVLGHLKSEFKEELVDMGAIEGEKKDFRIHPFEEFITDMTYLDSPATTVPPFNGRGNINAQVNPLDDYNLGRHAIDGFQQAEELTARFEATKFMSGYFRPRFEVDLPSGTGDDMTGHVYIQNAYATFTAGNFSIEFGRDSMLWGFGERGSLHFSTNPRPLDGVRITNPKPARLPWVFKYLGEWRYTLYGFNLGPEQARAWPWIAGYKFSLLPAKYVELGFGHTVEMGGEGAPSLSALDVLGEFTGFRPAGTDPTSPNKTNHMFEVDLLVRIPEASGLEIYGNMSVDDYWKSIRKTLTQGCSYMTGIYLPAINPSGSADLRVEFVWTNPLHYRHSLYPDGYTENQKLIGTDAGPDAYNLHALFRHTLSPKLWYGLSLDFDYRRSDSYTELRNPDGTAGPIVKTATGPAESRYRGVAELDLKFKKYNTLHFSAGYERVMNSQFQQGVDRNNFLLAASLNLNFDRHFNFSR